MNSNGTASDQRRRKSFFFPQLCRIPEITTPEKKIIYTTEERTNVSNMRKLEMCSWFFALVAAIPPHSHSKLCSSGFFSFQENHFFLCLVCKLWVVPTFQFTRTKRTKQMKLLVHWITSYFINANWNALRLFRISWNWTMKKNEKKNPNKLTMWLVTTKCIHWLIGCVLCRYPRLPTEFVLPKFISKLAAMAADIELNGASLSMESVPRSTMHHSQLHTNCISHSTESFEFWGRIAD